MSSQKPSRPISSTATAPIECWTRKDMSGASTKNSPTFPPRKWKLPSQA